MSRVQIDDAGTMVLDATVQQCREGSGPAYRGSPPPQVPMPEQCPDLTFPCELIPAAAHFEVRPANAARPLAGGDSAELIAWMKLSDVDGLAPWQQVTVLLDSLPPALYAMATGPAAIPTTAMSIYLSPTIDALATDWRLVRVRTEVANGGWAVDTSSVWNSRGELLGHASQQRRVMSPIR